MSKEASAQSKTCFVIMPISVPDGYEKGHFSRVYEHLIKPACERSGLACISANEVRSTNYIVIDILQRIIHSDLVVCDLSSRNPNVLYELGIRQAFNLPVVLIKDRKTERIFDIQGLRTLDYDETLRIDSVQKDVAALGATIGKTLDSSKTEVNSLIQLLGVEKAELSQRTEVSAEMTLILDAIQEMSRRVTSLEDHLSLRKTGKTRSMRTHHLPSGEPVKYAESVFDGNGNELGTFDHIDNDGVWIKYLEQRPDGATGFVLPPDDDRYNRLTTLPF